MKRNKIDATILNFVLSPILATVIMKITWLWAWKDFFWLSGMIFIFGIILILFSTTEIWSYTKYESPKPDKIYFVKLISGYYSYATWISEIEKWQVSKIITEKTKLTDMRIFELKNLHEIKKFAEI